MIILPGNPNILFPPPQISSNGGGGGNTIPKVFGVQKSSSNAMLISTQTGAKIQLRGVNVSCMEELLTGSTTPINPTNTTGLASNSTVQAYMQGADLGAYPWWSIMKSTFNVNCVRIPLNEATYLRTYTGQDVRNLGPTVLPDNADSTR